MEFTVSVRPCCNSRTKKLQFRQVNERAYYFREKRKHKPKTKVFYFKEKTQTKNKGRDPSILEN